MYSVQQTASSESALFELVFNKYPCLVRILPFSTATTLPFEEPGLGQDTDT
jgi:hypothetical protein